MARITSPKRPRGASRRFDTTSIAPMVEDGRVWIELAVVHKPPDVAAHWRKHTSQGGGSIILVEVQGVTSGQDLSARLSSAAGSVGQGLWRVPAVGDEVIVAMPAGDTAFMPTIIAVHASGAVPERASDDKTVLVATDEIQLQVGGRVVRVKGDKIQIGDSAAEPLVLGNQIVSLLTTMLNLLVSHVHPSAIPNGPSPALAPFTTEVANIQRIISDIAFTQKT